MESSDKQVIHLYEFEQQSINEKQLSKLIKDALQPYFGDCAPEIKFKGRPHKYWAYFEVEPSIAAKLSELKTINIGKENVNVGRYFHDYQIFVRKPDSVLKQKVREYFEQFGDVVDIVVTEPTDQKQRNHCYIKMKDDEAIDKIVLAKLHKIGEEDIKVLRTFGLGEDSESDKKLFLKIEGIPQSIEDFEQRCIEYFMKHGKVRERPKVESISGQKYKMIITFTNSKSANNALQDFPNSDLAEEYQRKNIALSLSYFHSKENKIYASGIKESDDRVIKEAFEVFGEISEFTTAKQKKNDLLTAVIGYVNEIDFKKALASYMEQPKVRALFAKQPFVTIFMTTEEKKAYIEMKKKQSSSTQQVKQSPSIPMAFVWTPQQMYSQFRMPTMGVPTMGVPTMGGPIPTANMPTMPQNFPTQNMPMMVPNITAQGGQFNQPPMGWQSKPIAQPKNN